MGIAAYVRRRRMHRAKKLLKNTTLSIGEIAHTVGFTDYNYFSRVYKKTYGKSPKRYR
jgi:AraC family L-rhamnose operon regulatory protein RhaS